MDKNKVNEALVLVIKAMSRLPDVACEIPAPLDGELAMSYAELKMVKTILEEVVK